MMILSLKMPQLPVHVTLAEQPELACQAVIIVGQPRDTLRAPFGIIEGQV
jgi:hypothetical protein